jgi:hypothetical protein
LLVQNYLNTKNSVLPQNGIIKEDMGLDLLKNKIFKKKDKIQTNILNFSNPYAKKYTGNSKTHLETSTNNGRSSMSKIIIIF